MQNNTSIFLGSLERRKTATSFPGLLILFSLFLFCRRIKNIKNRKKAKKAKAVLGWGRGWKNDQYKSEIFLRNTFNWPGKIT